MKRFFSTTRKLKELIQYPSITTLSIFGFTTLIYPMAYYGYPYFIDEINIKERMLLFIYCSTEIGIKKLLKNEKKLEEIILNLDPSKNMDVVILGSLMSNEDVRKYVSKQGFIKNLIKYWKDNQNVKSYIKIVEHFTNEFHPEILESLKDIKEILKEGKYKNISHKLINNLIQNYDDDNNNIEYKKEIQEIILNSDILYQSKSDYLKEIKKQFLKVKLIDLSLIYLLTFTYSFGRYLFRSLRLKFIPIPFLKCVQMANKSAFALLFIRVTSDYILNQKNNFKNFGISFNLIERLVTFVLVLMTIPYLSFIFLPHFLLLGNSPSKLLKIKI